MPDRIAAPGQFDRMSPASWGFVFGILAPILWSTSALFVKILPFAPVQIAGVRALIAGVALLPYWKPREIRPSAR